MRCFVALWPDDSTRNRLDVLARFWHQRFPRARRMRRMNLHLTLAFVGALEAEVARTISERLAQETWPGTSWAIDRIGAFDKARVLWAGSAADVGLDLLATRVRALLDKLKAPFDRKPFAPHVTLLRNLPREAFGTAVPLVDPIPWQTGAPVLLHSAATTEGVQYSVVGPPTA